jgi:multidrug efflux pump subunit AcrB
MKVVITTTEGVQIMSLVQDSNLSDALNKWASLHPNKYISHREMPDEAIPLDRTFRDAWVDTTPELTIDIDMDKARNIHLDSIRIERNAELSKLDIQATKAQDTGDVETLTQIRMRKQELRDLPANLASTLASAISIDELKAIQPLK